MSKHTIPLSLREVYWQYISIFYGIIYQQKAHSNVPLKHFENF